MGVAIGLDVGGTKILACSIDETGLVLNELKAPSEPSRKGMIDALCGVVRESFLQLGDLRHSLVGIGLGLPGLIDSSGILHETPNLRALEEMDVKEELGFQLIGIVRDLASGNYEQIALAIENDATAAAAGEFAFGAARNTSDALVITLGTGIGGGLIANGRVARGAAGFGGEVGHMVIDVNGPSCVCGRAGCWEQYASGTGIARLARESLALGPDSTILSLAGGELGDIRSEHVVEAARSGDGVATAVLEKAASYLAIGLGNIAEIFDPARIVIGGGLVEASDVLIQPAIDKMHSMRRGHGPHVVDVVLAQLGARAGAIGVAALGLGAID